MKHLIATVVFVLVTVSSVYAQPNTVLQAEEAAARNLQTMLELHPEPSVTRDMKHWAEQGRIEFVSEPGRPEIGLIPAGPMVSIIIDLYRYRYPSNDPEINRTHILRRQLELYATYIQLREHFAGRELITENTAPPEQRAGYRWRISLASIRAQWTLAKKLNRRDLMPGLTKHVARHGEDLGIVEYVFDAMKGTTSPPNLALFLPTWQKLYEQEKKKVAGTKRT